MATSHKCNGKGSNPLISSAEGSPAKTSPWPGSEPASPEPEADSGQNMSEPFAAYDHATSSWKTFQGYSPTPPWGEYSKTWPKAGMMRNGRSYLLPMSARPTCENGSGLWPTPNCSEERAEAYTLETSYRHFLEKRQTHLSQRVRDPRMWPTPQARDFRTGAGHRWENTEQRSRNLNDAVAHQVGYAMWPTPSVSDHKGSGTSGVPRDRLDYAAERGQTKHKRFPAPPQGGGQLNPLWVEWLMGYPSGWTELKDSATP